MLLPEIARLMIIVDNYAVRRVGLHKGRSGATFISIVTADRGRPLGLINPRWVGARSHLYHVAGRLNRPQAQCLDNEGEVGVEELVK